MMLFWAIAAALTVAALLFLLPPLVRRRTAAPEVRAAANAAIYREQLEELAAELQRGTVTKQEFERTSREMAEIAGGELTVSRLSVAAARLADLARTAS